MYQLSINNSLEVNNIFNAQNYKKKLDFLKKKKLQLKSRFNNKKTKPQFDRYLKKKFQFIFIIIQVAILE